MYGDPHIRTLDGFGYTFNGLGEYTLIETTHDNFTLQGRTAKARDVNGTETDATVFSAFAARDVDSDTVHIGMNATRDGMCHDNYVFIPQLKVKLTFVQVDHLLVLFVNTAHGEPQ